MTVKRDPVRQPRNGDRMEDWDGLRFSAVAFGAKGLGKPPNSLSRLQLQTGHFDLTLGSRRAETTRRRLVLID